MCCARIYQHCNLLVGGGGRFRSSRPRPLLSTVCFQSSAPCSLCNTSLPQHAVVCRRRRSQPGESSDCSRGATGVLCPHGRWADVSSSLILATQPHVCLTECLFGHAPCSSCKSLLLCDCVSCFLFFLLLLCWHIKDKVKFLCGNIKLN